MRDALILAIVASAALYAMRQPWIGMLLWTWLSLMYPHEQWGYATASMPLAAIAAAATLFGLLATTERRNPFDRPANIALLVFAIWICITLPFSFYITDSRPLWERSMKIFLMVFVSIALIDTKKKLDWFIAICTTSVAFYGVKGGLFTIATGGSYRVWGPGGFIYGNNEVAVAIIMVIPLLRYLQLQTKTYWLRHIIFASILLCAVGALGTQSRGALVSITTMVLFLWLRSQKKILGGALLISAGVVMLSLMSEYWWQRMDTIQSYEQDDSALGRLNAWQFAWRLAQDNFFGGGFSVYSAELFLKYSHDPNRIHAAHSIYFQVLGEHGFVGLLIFVTIGIFTWLDAKRLINIGTADSNFRWAADLGQMAQVSMIGFATGGAFLSLAYYDLPYNIMIIIVSAIFVVKMTISRASAESANKKAAEKSRKEILKTQTHSAS